MFYGIFEVFFIHSAEYTVLFAYNSRGPLSLQAQSLTERQLAEIFTLFHLLNFVKYFDSQSMVFDVVNL